MYDFFGQRSLATSVGVPLARSTSQTGVFFRSTLTFFEVWISSDAALASSLPVESGLLITPWKRAMGLKSFLGSLSGVTLPSTSASLSSAPVMPAIATPVSATVEASAIATTFRDFLNNFFPPQKSKRANSRAGSDFCTHCGATCPGGMSVNTANCDKLRPRLFLLTDSQGLGRVGSGSTRWATQPSRRPAAHRSPWP